jgi:hypothetical protein
MGTLRSFIKGATMPLTNAETAWLQGWASYFNGAARPPTAQADRRKGWDAAKATAVSGGYGPKV